MNTLIQNLIEQHNYSEAMTEALALFSSGNLSPLALKEKLKEHGSSVENLRWEAVDVIVDYVELALEDNILSQEEMHTLRMMKLFFRVKEGDFLKQHKETQIEQIICRQLALIYQDNQVNTQESLMKVDLQELFGLSYDQFLKFERKALEQALCNGADIKNLDTFCVTGFQTKYYQPNGERLIDIIKPGEKKVRNNKYDERLEEAAEYVVFSQRASINMLERKLDITNSRAGRIITQLEELGIVGIMYGSCPRKVLVSNLMDLKSLLEEKLYYTRVDSGIDEMFYDAARLVVSSQFASTSLLQRKLLLGYNRAGRIIDQLENAGIVGHYNGATSREVLIKNQEDLELLLSKIKASK